MRDEKTLAYLSELAKVVNGEYEKEREGKPFYGELLTVNVNGKAVKMRHHDSTRQNAPVYIDIHGGGWTWGSIDNGDELLHNFNQQLDCEIYSIDYPLVPEAFYPEAVYHLYEVINFLRINATQFNIDPTKMMIGGRSAGGNLSAALCLLAKERGDFQFLCQCLDYPALDLSMTLIKDEDRYQGDRALKVDELKMLMTTYSTDAERLEIYASPLLATLEQLADLPPAAIQTCEYDSVCDGDLYAKKLKEAGVSVKWRCFPEEHHGFTEKSHANALDGQQFFIDFMKHSLNM